MSKSNFNSNATAINEFSWQTGAHQYHDGAVWEEHDGPSYLGTFRNDGGEKIPVMPRAWFWSRCPWAAQGYREGLFDLENPQARRNAEAISAFARIDRALERRLERLEEEARLAKAAKEAARLAKAAEVVSRGSWLVETAMGGWPSFTVHASKEEAEKAALRPSESGTIRQGDYALHRGGWVSRRGREYVRRAWDE